VFAGVRAARLIGLAACVLALLGSQFAVRADAATTSRIVDRTLACTVAFSNGARTIDANVRSAYRSGSTMEWLAQATVTTAGNPLPKKNYEPTLAGLTAGWPPPPPLESGGLGFASTRCSTTRSRVPVSSAGLTGGSASVFGDEVRCRTPKTILVRVRATFSAPATLEPSKDGTFVGASGRIVRGQVVVRTLAGAQLAFADVTDAGKAHLFASKVCT
jgi:hypothetical protein